MKIKEKPAHVRIVEEKMGYEYISRRYGKGGWFLDPDTNELYKYIPTYFWPFTREGNLRDGRVRSWGNTTKITMMNYLSHNIPEYIYQIVVGKSLK
jgi:hypothetical protein|tara:strand:- start:432 stop:719 length:288 start_codon:yes stop_codon:yes gene_type:complete